MSVLVFALLSSLAFHTSAQPQDPQSSRTISGDQAYDFFLRHTPSAVGVETFLNENASKPEINAALKTALEDPRLQEAMKAGQEFYTLYSQQWIEAFGPSTQDIDLALDPLETFERAFREWKDSFREYSDRPLTETEAARHALSQTLSRRQMPLTMGEGDLFRSLPPGVNRNQISADDAERARELELARETFGDNRYRNLERSTPELKTRQPTPAEIRTFIKHYQLRLAELQRRNPQLWNYKHSATVWKRVIRGLDILASIPERIGLTFPLPPFLRKRLHEFARKESLYSSRLLRDDYGNPAILFYHDDVAREPYLKDFAGFLQNLPTESTERVEKALKAKKKNPFENTSARSGADKFVRLRGLNAELTSLEKLQWYGFSFSRDHWSIRDHVAHQAKRPSATELGFSETSLLRSPVNSATRFSFYKMPIVKNSGPTLLVIGQTTLSQLNPASLGRRRDLALTIMRRLESMVESGTIEPSEKEWTASQGEVYQLLSEISLMNHSMDRGDSPNVLLATGEDLEFEIEIQKFFWSVYDKHPEWFEPPIEKTQIPLKKTPDKAKAEAKAEKIIKFQDRYSQLPTPLRSALHTLNFMGFVSMATTAAVGGIMLYVATTQVIRALQGPAPQGLALRETAEASNLSRSEVSDKKGQSLFEVNGLTPQIPNNYDLLTAEDYSRWEVNNAALPNDVLENVKMSVGFSESLLGIFEEHPQSLILYSDRPIERSPTGIDIVPIPSPRGYVPAAVEFISYNGSSDARKPKNISVIEFQKRGLYYLDPRTPQDYPEGFRMRIRFDPKPADTRADFTVRDLEKIPGNLISIYRRIIPEDQLKEMIPAGKTYQEISIPRSMASMFLSLPPLALSAEIDRLKDAGFTQIAQRIKSPSVDNITILTGKEIPSSETIPSDLNSIARAFEAGARYSYVPEGQKQKFSKAELEANPYLAYSRFVPKGPDNVAGFACYQCSGAAELFKTFLVSSFGSSSEVEVGTITTLKHTEGAIARSKKTADGDSKTIYTKQLYESDMHAETRVHYHSIDHEIILDTTPSQMDPRNPPEEVKDPAQPSTISKILTGLSKVRFPEWMTNIFESDDASPSPEKPEVDRPVRFSVVSSVKTFFKDAYAKVTTTLSQIADLKFAELDPAQLEILEKQAYISGRTKQEDEEELKEILRKLRERAEREFKTDSETPKDPEPAAAAEVEIPAVSESDLMAIDFKPIKVPKPKIPRPEIKILEAYRGAIQAQPMIERIRPSDLRLGLPPARPMRASYLVLRYLKDEISLFELQKDLEAENFIDPSPELLSEQEIMKRLAKTFESERRSFLELRVRAANVTGLKARGSLKFLKYDSVADPINDLMAYLEGGLKAPRKAPTTIPPKCRKMVEFKARRLK